MDVTDRAKARDRVPHIVGLDDHHEVDYRLRGEIDDGCGADVLDRDSEVADRGRRAIADPLELERPGRIVVDDDDWVWH